MLPLYRLVLLLLPPAFRRRYGEDLRAEAELVAAEGRQSGARTGTWIRLWGDVLRTLGREWREAALDTITGSMGGGVGTDLKWAWRALRRSPGFSTAVIGTLALGIGASTVALALVDAYLLRSLPYPEGDRLVAIWTDQNWSRSMIDMTGEGLETFEGVAGLGGAILVLQEGGEPAEIYAVLATTNLFTVLGVPAALGRGFVTEDGDPAAEPVVVLSHGLWSRRFGSDPDVLGRSIRLGGNGAQRRTVVGVMPEDYEPLNGTGVDAWVPVDMDRSAGAWDDSYFMKAVGRLRPGASLASTQAEVKRWAERVRATKPGWFSPDEVERSGAMLLARQRTGSRRVPLLAALGAALLVLVVACANVANLLVARTMGRDRELSVRAALGAGRARTARAIVLEVLLLAGMGALGGLAVAAALIRGLQTTLPEVLPSDGLALDARAVGAAMVLALAAALVAGVAPALHAARRDPARALSGGRGTRGSRGVTRLQEWLSSSQLAFATAGIAAMALLGRTLIELDSIDLGFTGASTVTFRVTAPPEAYPDDADVTRFFREAGRALNEVPGAASAGFVSRLPMGGGDSRISVAPEGHEMVEGLPAPEVWHRLVTPGYLESIGARVVAGHLPTPADDRDGLPLEVVINRSAATRFWPGESALGKRFYGPERVVWATVAGVVEDLHEGGAAAAVLPALYIPHRDWPWRTMTAVVSTQSDVATILPALKGAVWGVSAGVPISRVQSLQRVMDRSLRPTRLLTILAAGVGAVTLLLGGLGLYGVISHGVARRMRELGVRAALGADRGQLLRGELRSASRIVTWGLLVGLVAAWGVGKGLQGLLFGVPAFDLPSLGLAAVVLAAVAYAAALLPARRAAAVDPALVMREE